jgi:hypothetical protein
MLLLASAGVLLLGGLAWVFTCTSLCGIERINIHGVKYGVPEDMLLESGIKRGVNIFSDLGGFERALRAHPLVKSARFERKPPRALSIHIEEREPFVLLKTKRPVPLSIDGLIVPSERIGVELELPLLTIEGEIGGFRSSVDAGLHFLSEMRNEAPCLLPLVSELVVRDGEPVEMYLRSPRARVLIGSGSLKPACGLLLGVVKVLAKEEGFFEIDLRFRNQAVLRILGDEGSSRPRAI